MRKKWLSLFMALVMLFSCFTPVSVLAEEAPYMPGPDDSTKTYHLDNSNFGDFVSNFAMYATWRIELHADINLSDKPAYTTALFNANFSGTFDGGGHTISGLQINHTVSAVTTDSWTGMFPKLLSGATVTNFTLADSSIISNGCAVGAVAGQISGASISDVIITNTTVQGSGQVGGIVSQTSGANNSITDCSFGGSVISTNFHSAGGIVGFVDSGSSVTISKCANSGAVDGVNTGVGGILGYAFGTETTISECSNTGNVTGSNTGVGGIVGRAGTACTIEKCANRGTIKATANYGAGGIVGYAAAACAISGCSNTGNVSVTGSNDSTGNGAGGIVGRAGAACPISDCSNTGVVAASHYGAGGIVGHITTASTISGCANSGAISAGYGAGGIVGNKQNAAKLTVNSSLNTGALSSTNLGYVGGIVGRLASAGGTNAFIAEISGCLSTGSLSTVKNGNAVGGIVGFTNVPNDWGAKMTNCYTTYSRITGDANTGTYNTVDTNSAVRTAAQLTSANAIINAPGLDFAGRTWAVVEGGTPVLAALSDGNVLYYDWYVGQSSTYSIANANALKAFALLSQVRNFSGETVQLTQSISGVGEFPMIGTTSLPFAGTFDGQGKTISGLTIKDTSSANSVGLFRRISGATVRNFKLTGSTITTNSLQSGVIVGRSQGGTVENVYTDATFEAGNIQLGGIVGSTWGATTTVRNCWFAGTMNLTNAKPYAGGIVGESRQGTLTVENCLLTGSITANTAGDGKRLGGIVGRTAGDETIVRHCLATGVITTNSNKAYEGPIVGLVADTEKAAVSDCYATTTTGYGYLYSHTDGVGNVAGTALAPEQLTGANAIINAPALDFAGGTWVAVADGTPVLATLRKDVENVYLGWYVNHDTPYSLANKNALQGFAALSKSHDFSDKTVQLTADIPDVGEFPMIGTTSLPFAGTFDGNGNTISGLTIDAPSTDLIGMFSRVASSSTIRNFKLLDSTISGGSLSGAIIGRSDGCTVESVYTDATFTSAQRCLGGIVGSTWGTAATTTVRNCWFAGTMNLTLSGNNFYAGGIVGENREGALTIDNCLFTGSIITKTENGSRLGGILGTARSGDVFATVSHCLATGTITSNPNMTYEGPIVGLVEDTGKATVSDCYATTTTGYDYLYSHTDHVGFVAGTALAPAQLTGANAIINAPALDFAGGTWVAVEDRTPVLAALRKDVENVYLGWYVDHDTPYSIANKNALQGFAALSKSHDFSDKTVQLTADIPDVGEFPMIGSDAVPFAGIFDGGGNTISGLTIDETVDSVGLFARISGARIQNFKLTGSTVTTTGNYAGAIVGRATGGTNTVSGVYSNAAVTGKHMSGGLIGYASDDTNKIATTVNLSDSWFDGSVTVTEAKNDRTVGGLIGQVGNEQVTLAVTDCLFTGTLAVAEGTTSNQVGGLVGRVHKTTSVTLRDCVSAAGTQTQGGLAVGRASDGGSVALTDVYAAENGELPAIVSGTSTGDATILTASQLTGYSAVVNATGLDFTEKWTVIVDGVAQPTAVRSGTTATAPSNYYADISSYRGETYTAPEELTGKIFAGWYLDENFTVALNEETTDGAAFAKWVDQNILNVYYQYKGGANLNNARVTMRVLTSVDCLDYQKVRFEFKNADTDAVVGTFDTTKTYTQIMADGKAYTATSKSENMDTYLWSEDSTLICGYNINVGSSLYDTRLIITAKWVTADGTEVSGTPKAAFTLRNDLA